MLQSCILFHIIKVRCKDWNIAINTSSSLSTRPNFITSSNTSWSKLEMKLTRGQEPPTRRLEDTKESITMILEQYSVHCYFFGCLIEADPNQSDFKMTE